MFVLQSLLPVAQLPDHPLGHYDPALLAHVCCSAGLCNGLSGVNELRAPVRGGETGGRGVCVEGGGEGCVKEGGGEVRGVWREEGGRGCEGGVGVKEEGVGEGRAGKGA